MFIVKLIKVIWPSPNKSLWVNISPCWTIYFTSRLCELYAIHWHCPSSPPSTWKGRRCNAVMSKLPDATRRYPTLPDATRRFIYSCARTFQALRECTSGGTNQTIIWLIDKFSLFEINRYLINLYQTIQIIQKGDFWGKNRRFLAI
jgi:hypothetical protein